MSPERASPRLLLLSVLVFVASLATLVLELVASRVLAPFVGVSLHTWTCVIGVVLLGISTGSDVGGRLAHAGFTLRRLGLLLALGALLALVPLGMAHLLGDGAWLKPIPILPRALLLSLVGFFPVTFVLSMVTPLALRLLLPDLARAGRTAGFVYGLATLGSLVGNFFTGFVLLAHLTVPQIVFMVAVMLAGCASLTLLGGPVVVPALAPSASASTPLRSDGLDLRSSPLLACVVVASASFCTLLIELAASRILAPTLGVSLFSWTGIIGVVLGGMALGNYVGGHLADRRSSTRLLGASLLSAATLGLLIPLFHRWMEMKAPLEGLGLMARVVAYSAFLFFVPLFALGTISPQVLKLALPDMAQAGRIAGRLYAWSTVGALVGTFATGWFLISWLGVYRLVLIASLGLVLIAALVSRAWNSRKMLLGAAIPVGIAAVLGQMGTYRSLCTVESDYFCIAVYPASGRPGVQVLRMDHLIHTFAKVDDPTFLGYFTLHLDAEFMRAARERVAQPRLLVVGGGGYALPRWAEAVLPGVKVDVVEIDPAVTKVARERFGVAPDSRMVSYNIDARQFVQELGEPGIYDVIAQDIANDLSIPFHLLTVEYDRRIRALLKRDGLYVVNVNDDLDQGILIRSVVRTMREAFPSVQLIYDEQIGPHGKGSVLVGASRPVDFEAMRRFLRSDGLASPRALAFTAPELDRFVAAGPAILLTDSFAPVDNLLAQMILERWEKAGQH